MELDVMPLEAHSSKIRINVIFKDSDLVRLLQTLEQSGYKPGGIAQIHSRGCAGCIELEGQSKARIISVRGANGIEYVVEEYT